jgi:transposase-like protein
MSCYQKIHCPYCDHSKIIKSGKSSTGAQRYLCQHAECETQTFMLDYQYKACEAGMTEKIVEMAINSGGIRDTARVLKINKNTVINRLKKKKTALSKSTQTSKPPLSMQRLNLSVKRQK